MTTPSNQQLSDDYKYRVMSIWLDAVAVGVEFRTSYMDTNGNVKDYVWNHYVAILTRLWVELAVGMKGISNQDEVGGAEAEVDFFSYEHYVYDPIKFREATPEMVFKFEASLRNAINQLKITRF